MHTTKYPTLGQLVVGLCAATSAVFANQRALAAPPEGAARAQPTAPALAQPIPALPPATPESPALASTRQALSLARAMQTALRLTSAVQTARAELRGSGAERDAARGPFDPVLEASVSHRHDVIPGTPDVRVAPGQGATRLDTTELTVGATVGTTWGTSIEPSVGLARVHQRPVSGASLLTPYQTANVGVTLVQHLLRGAGTVGAASAVERAGANYRAAERNVDFVAQEQTFRVALAYYELVVTEAEVQLLREAEQAARRLAEEVRALVAADQRPRTDLHQIDGNVATRAVSLRSAQNDQARALYALRAAMGLGVDVAPLPLPSDGLPAARLPAEDGSALVRVALGRRADLAAVRSLVAGRAADLRGAQWNTKPALDVTASMGYAGFLDKDGAGAFFAASVRNVPGINAGIRLSLELPVQNTARVAERDSKLALHQEARIAQGDLERQLGLDTLSTLDELRLSVSVLEASSLAVDNLSQAVRDEQDRLRSGMGTVLDLILTEDRLIAARLARTSHHLRYAVARARLVFQTGGMPSSVEDVPSALSELAGGAASHAGK